MPNKASYVIGVKSIKLNEDGTPVLDENGKTVKEDKTTPKYDDESNTVTVKPEEDETVEIKISKVDIVGNEIEGAEIQIKQGDTVVESWTSTTEVHELTLKPGEYVFHEEAAPNGYVAVTDITFTVDEAGKITVTDTKADYAEVDENGVLVITDEYAPHEVNISKADLDGTEVPGATIKVTGEDFEETWVSTNETHELTLQPGKYTLVEEVAPEGFKKVTTTIEFTVDTEGKVEVLTQAVENGKVAVKEDGTLVLFDEPDETPAIEKYVNKNVHKDIALDEVFTYDVLAYITKDADTVTIKDELVADLQIVSAAADVAVADLGTEEPDHKPNGSVAKEGAAVTGAKATVDGNNLTVEIADAKALRGHWVKVTFDAKIADGKTIEDLAQVTIDKNAPVITDEKHEGVPNKASYEIGVKSLVLDENGHPTFDENGNVVKEDEAAKKYEDESNTVTVRPEEDETVEIKISKVDIAGNEIEGAQIEIRDTKGEAVESWTSTTEVHELTLKPGTYVFHEEAAPHGYTAVTDVVFSVDENSVVTVETVEANYALVDENGVLVITDDYMPHNVQISKADLDGKEVPGATITVTGDNFSETWVSTDKSHNLILKPGTYTLVEDVAPEGFKKVTTTIEFTVDINGNVEVLTQKVENGKVAVKEDGTLVLFDEPEIEYIDIPVAKTWVGSEADESAPESVIVRLLKNGKEINFAVLNKDNGWAHTFTDLVKSEGGKENTYTITEDAVDNYTSEINGYNVTNTYTPGNTTVSVYKTWTGDNAGKRPESIVVNLLADGVVAASKTVTAEDNWFTTFTELPILNEAGARINYTVEEQPVAGYTGTVTGSADTNYVINNDRIRVDVNISKQAVGGGPELEGATLVVADEEGNRKGCSCSRSTSYGSLYSY